MKRVSTSSTISSVSTSSKCYCSWLERMLNDKKSPLISPLFHNNNFISNLKEKSELFHDNFSRQCLLIRNRSTIPLVFTPQTHKSFLLCQIAANDLESIINKLDPEKVYCHYMISIHMIKFSRSSICKSLEMIFKSCLNQGISPEKYKKANIVLAYKKVDHQCVTNYRSVSLLPLFSKIFEKHIYEAMLKHFSENNLIPQTNPVSNQMTPAWTN